MSRRTLSLFACILVFAVPGSIAAYDFGRPDAKMIAGDLVLPNAPVTHASATGLSLRGWDGGSWQPPPATHVTMTLLNVNSRERREFVIAPDGTLGGDTKLVEQFFRCKRSGRTHAMEPGVLAVLADVARTWPGKTIEVVSGFRRRGTGARRSKHYTGHAIDFRVPGVPEAEVRDYIWAHHDKIGLGHYHSEGFLHIDYRPDEPKIGWNQHRASSRYRYHPSWTAAP